MATLVVVAALAPATAHAAAPSNDNFSGALPLLAGGEVMGNTVDATHETNETLPANGDLKESDCALVTDGPRCTTSVWYRFEPSTGGDYTIETCDLGTDLDTVLAVYTGTGVASLTEVTSNDDACAGGPNGDNGSRVSFTATAETTYWVEVAGYGAAQGTFWLRAYGGSTGRPTPEPDTLLQRDASFTGAENGGGLSLDGARHSASFSFTSDHDEASFECSLDDAAFSVCHSPMSFDGLTGTHTFRVRSVVGPNVDPTPAGATFSIDGTPPDTSFLSVPPDPTSNPTADFELRSSERSPNDAFFCAIDAQQLRHGCDGSTDYNELCNGLHTFSAAAVDTANNADATPATTSFHETGGPESCASPNLTVSPQSVSPTDEELNTSVNVHGDGGSLLLEYGTTSSYGFSATQPVDPGQDEANTFLRYLQPGTLYHYRMTLTTNAGTIGTGDATFTTATAGSAAPTVSLGTPVVVGTHAVSLPLTADPGAFRAVVGVFVDTGPIEPKNSPEFDAIAEVPSGGPAPSSIDVVDLDPGTYHARAFVEQDGGVMDALSPEITFTIEAPAAPSPPSAGPAPAVIPPPLPAVHRFKLRGSFVKVLTIHRGSKTLALVIRHLPPASVVSVAVNATVRASSVKRLAKGHAKANKAGVAKVKIKLSRRARKLLRSKHTKSLAFKVRVKPPGQAATSLTLYREVKR